MGEIAEMMLEGILCEGCGEYLEDAVGYPRRCTCCGGGKPTAGKKTGKPTAPKVECRICGKKVKKGQGMRDHLRVVHPKGERV